MVIFKKYMWSCINCLQGNIESSVPANYPGNLIFVLHNYFYIIFYFCRYIKVFYKSIKSLFAGEYFMLLFNLNGIANALNN